MLKVSEFCDHLMVKFFWSILGAHVLIAATENFPVFGQPYHQRSKFLISIYKSYYCQWFNLRTGLYQLNISLHIASALITFASGSKLASLFRSLENICIVCKKFLLFWSTISIKFYKIPFADPDKPSKDKWKIRTPFRNFPLFWLQQRQFQFVN